jgi:hypothetical protein
VSDLENKGTVGLPESGARRIPLWGLIVGVILFPLGFFIALAAARALRWRIAVPLALGTYLLMVLFVRGMALAGAESPRCQGFVLLGFGFYYIAVGQLQYAIGRDHGLWSDRGRRIWRIVGFTAMAVVLLDGLVIALRLFIPSS